MPPDSLAKSLIEQALAPVLPDLAELNQRLLNYLPTETATGRAVAEHVLGAGGKRIRPAMFFMACRLIKYYGEHLYPIAAVTEFVHTASLLHDDVVDNSSLRRNRPTANSIYGSAASVLVGDLIYSTASEMMAATGNMDIVRTFARAIRLMSDGELLQLENVFNPDISELTYLTILEYKTAVLLEASCQAAGLLSGAPKAQSDALMQFGHNVGMAFQLIDDALDYTGSAAIVGKETHSDLLEGKVTLPVIMLKGLATASEWTEISSLINTSVHADTVTKIATFIDKYDTAALTVDRAHQYTMKAMAALHSFPHSPARDCMENLANKLLFRFN
ncbi:MAG: polyprenyl synthetase family protein [Proteobacteria bacterium]|nr:polyprenyl synthetase family protein [Pseudomonadota bacterium]